MPSLCEKSSLDLFAERTREMGSGLCNRRAHQGRVPEVAAFVADDLHDVGIAGDVTMKANMLLEARTGCQRFAVACAGVFACYGNWG
jgi:hypothetical protein